MKIDTLEKLEILLFGLNAGRDLDIGIQSGTGDALQFCDCEITGFNIENTGIIEPSAYDTGALYMLLGCIQSSKEEAAQWFSHISKKGGSEDASNS